MPTEGGSQSEIGRGGRFAVAAWASGFLAIVRRHWLFSTFVLLAVVLRVVVSLAYWPGLEFWADSYDYLRLARVLTPGVWHPSGYALLLVPLSVTGQVGVIVVVQHLMGIAMGVLVYAFALRLTRRRWLAAIAALPILLDGYELDIEQLILAETLTDLLLLGGMVVLLWRDELTWRRGVGAGLLLAAATVTRPAVEPVLVVVGLYLLIRRSGRWRALLAYCAAAALVLGAYGGWYATANGSFGFSDTTGFYLYGRVAPIATCHYSLPPKEAALCPKQPVSRRTQNTEYFADYASSPVRGLHYLGGRHQRNVLGEQFAIDVIEHQPLDYAKVVLADTWHYFSPGRWMTWDRVDMRRWVFPPPHIHPKVDAYHIHFANVGFNGLIKPSPDRSLMGPLRTYQSIFYTPGPALLACVILALGAGLGLVRRRAGRREARWAGLVLAITALVLVLSPSLITGFSYRYGLPLLVLLPPAGVAALDIGLDALAGARVPGLARLRSRVPGFQRRTGWIEGSESVDYRT